MGFLFLAQAANYNVVNVFLHFTSLGFTLTTTQDPLHGNGNGPLSSTTTFDPFVTASAQLATPGAINPQVPTNPYSHDGSLGGAPFFSGQNSFQQPVYRLNDPFNFPRPNLASL